ncbi:hypothetical protein L7F22_027955 [Adiantum nelumboides]|nr:hypothetical protein [Adiantum nelumboides]
MRHLFLSGQQRRCIARKQRFFWTIQNCDANKLPARVMSGLAFDIEKKDGNDCSVPYSQSVKLAAQGQQTTSLTQWSAGQRRFFPEASIGASGVKIKKLCETLETPEWAQCLKAMFSDFSLRLSPALTAEIVQATKSADLVFKFCIWAASQQEIAWYSAGLSDMLLKAIKNVRHVKEVREVLVSLNADGYNIPVELWNILIKSYCYYGLADEAMQVLHQMNDLGSRPTTFSYNTILDTFVKENKLASAHKIFKRMAHEGCQLNKATYDIMLHCHGKAGLVKGTYLLLHEMEQNGFKPDVITYSRLIDGLCKVGVVSEAYTLFTEMMSKGCHPNVVTYSAMIGGLFKAGRITEMWNLLKTMKQVGCIPNVYTYSILINGLSKCGKLDDACRLLDDMLDQGCTPNEVTYSTLITSFCRRNQVKEAHGVFRKMLNRGCVPDTVTFNALLVGVCKVGWMDTAFTLVHEMLQRNCLPTTTTFNILLNCLCKAKTEEVGLHFLFKTIEYGCAPNVVMDSMLMEELCKAGKLSQISKFLDSLRYTGCCPDVVTYSTLIYGLCKSNRLDQARWLLHEKGCTPNVIMYTTMIDGLCKAKNMEAAYSMLVEMEENGCKPDSVTFCTVIDALCHVEGTRNAYKIAKGMLNKGLIPNPVTYNSLIDLLCKENRVNEAFQMVEETIKKGVAPDIVTFSALVDGLCSEGRMHEAHKMWEDINMKGLLMNKRRQTKLLQGKNLLVDVDIFNCHIGCNCISLFPSFGTTVTITFNHISITLRRFKLWWEQVDILHKYSTKKGGSKRFKCKRCSVERSGGPNRIKEHLLHISGEGIDKCKNSSQTDRERMEREYKQYLESRKPKEAHTIPVSRPIRSEPFSNAASSARSFSTTTSSAQGGPSSAQGRQSTLFTSWHPQRKAQVDATVARMFYSCGVSFNVACSEFFKEMVSEIANFGPTYQSPSYDALREKLLEEEISSIREAITQIKQKWSAYGVSLVADGWTDGRSRLEGLLAACRVTWWEDYGADVPQLQSLAIKILSHVCSLSAIERLWSTFGHIHSKKRNRLGVQKANDLVFVNANLRLPTKMKLEYTRDLYIGFHKNEQDSRIWEGIDEEENEADEELVHNEDYPGDPYFSRRHIELTAEIHRLQEMRSDFSHHASVSYWILTANRMNKDFFAIHRERPAESTMRAIRDGSIVLHIDPDQVLAIATDFYEDLFTVETVIRDAKHNNVLQHKDDADMDLGNKSDDAKERRREEKGKQRGISDTKVMGI